ncbi:hypothetical protein BDZ85DRAFT_233051 [Elsinoe ampelina]|uniref:Cell wall protein PhiA n=1 Tax=Elsinoe ampelina TaxID=302913 RepID=A0A6A6GGM2_9PEZI|nr:hypothetical protein BDZ85DRAFT_233051 [Elsinoe ampelina]
MFTTTSFLTLLTTALALPAPPSTPSPAPAPQPFLGIAIRSASPIQYAPINATSLAISLLRPTTTYCPSIPNLPCPSNPSTLFVGPSSSGTLSLKTSVPGGQQVYIAADGRARFTQAHSADTNGGAVTGFGVAGGALQWRGNDWLACPEGEEGYAVYAAQGWNRTDAGCLGFRFRVEDAGSAEGAWQYA